MGNQEILSTADKTKDVLCIIYHLYDPLNNTEKQTILVVTLMGVVGRGE